MFRRSRGNGQRPMGWCIHLSRLLTSLGVRSLLSLRTMNRFCALMGLGLHIHESVSRVFAWIGRGFASLSRRILIIQFILRDLSCPLRWIGWARNRCYALMGL